ncbi:MAG TPA: hypothetical protein VFQ53_38345 [Kofleriaceae bacterium]|nr:hypothetical protein [Kofleriaceae bacterium]
MKQREQHIVALSRAYDFFVADSASLEGAIGWSPAVDEGCFTSDDATLYVESTDADLAALTEAHEATERALQDEIEEERSAFLFVRDE